MNKVITSSLFLSYKLQHQHSLHRCRFYNSLCWSMRLFHHPDVLHLSGTECNKQLNILIVRLQYI